MIDSLVRPNIRSLQPYSSARSLYQTGVFFDANENALGSTASIPGNPELNRYPDPYSKELRDALSKYLNISEKNIFAGNGSDEIIDLLIRIFVNPSEAIVVLEPTYGMYKVAADTAGVEVCKCPLNKEFQVDLEALWRATSLNSKIIFCCSPNNPTGNVLRAEDIAEMCKKFNGIVVVDEAYIEFASTPSVVDMVAEFENLVVLRTFSKAWGLAGIRVGYAIADKKVIAYLDKVKAPYNLNRVSSATAVRALSNKGAMLDFKKITLEERERVGTRLKNLGFRVFPSDANFLLVEYADISKIARRLAEEFGLIIRDFGNKELIEDCARISIATPEQNNQLLQALEKIL